MKKIKGASPDFVINDEVTGGAMLQVNKRIDMTQGKVKNAMQRLMISWNATEIIMAANRTPKCLCPAPVADIKVRPDVAYALARKSPARESATQGVTSLAAQYGGRVPLWALGKVLGPWDMLIEELTQKRR